MNATSQNKLARLKRILERQDPPRWGADYIPSIKATREEAPANSRPSTLFSIFLQRDCHALSLPEQAAILLALYHPGLFELHEQRMLATDPRPHPLAGHPRAAGMVLPPLRGTVDVADRLGVLEYHDRVYLEDPEQAGKRLPVPIPFIGDLLLFLAGDEQPYCVNWTIKLDDEGFEAPHWQGKVPRDASQAHDGEAIRHAIEEALYRDVGIRTVRVTHTTLDKTMIGNLRRIFGWTARKLDIHDEDRAEILERLRAAVIRQVPPLDVFVALQRRIPCDMHTKKAVLFQAIWQRELRVDMFDNVITVDRPLREEQEDVLVRYQNLFSQEAP